ncbi:MAG: histidine kinase dimerization/phospho-acceptor domain-containing protein [Thermodesulfobacteriota bacterium]|nr:histidine kinase dimerization/phospho-acceptor domain-containing protein [Thermodesulfobacteriota bacterium]
MVRTDFLREVANILQKGLGTEDTFDAVFDLLEKTVPFDSATLYLYRHENNRLEVIHQKGEDIVELAGEISFDRGRGISSWVSKQKKPVIFQSLATARPGKERRFSSFVSMPLWGSEELLGVLNLGHQRPDVYKDVENEDYAVVSTQISIVLEKMLLQRQLQEKNRLLKETLEELRDAQKKLIEKERLAAIGEVVVTVNHEINNPLTSIIALAEILEAEDQEKVRETLEIILREARRIQSVTHKLARISSSQTEEYFGSTRMTKLPD